MQNFLSLSRMSSKKAGKNVHESGIPGEQQK